MKNKSGYTIKALRSNRGGEFTSKEFSSLQIATKKCNSREEEQNYSQHGSEYVENQMYA